MTRFATASKVLVSGLAMALLFTAPASAGQRADDFVSINTIYRVASGALGSARNSSDGMQFIGCGVYAYATSQAYVSCAAYDAKGRYASCVSTSPELVKAGQTIGSDSDITFSWDAAGSCAQLNVFNGSNTPPKAP